MAIPPPGRELVSNILCVARRGVEDSRPLLARIDSASAPAGDWLIRAAGWREDDVLVVLPLSESGVGEPCLDEPPTGNCFAVAPAGRERDDHELAGVVELEVVVLTLLNRVEPGTELLSSASEFHADSTEK